ncbi:MAG TPA: hypothetical protein VJG65_00640 [Patescibacteria group bacterium]|nr:hypothetical protein [Patescibacteria group bacterium]
MDIIGLVISKEPSWAKKGPFREALWYSMAMSSVVIGLTAIVILAITILPAKLFDAICFFGLGYWTAYKWP